MSALIKALCRAMCLHAMLLLLLSMQAAAQTNIQSTKLRDGVERWHRVKAAAEKPWFFQQVENLYRVILPPKEKLPFDVSVAFLVGVSQYDYLQPNLPFVENDLTDMREFLLNQGGFDTVYVVANQVATPGLVENYMTNRFRRSLSSRDRLLFYYSGHGADLGGSTGYIQFSKAVRDDFANHVLAVNRCMEWSKIIKAGHILFVYDCCASGLAFGAKSGGEAEAYTQILSALSGDGSRVVITAGTANEKTYEVPRPGGKGNGVFTRAFLNAASSFKPGPQQAGFMTINQIFAQAEIGVKNFAATYDKKLSPRRWELQEHEYRGTFVFVNPSAPNLVLPAEYAQALQARERGPAVAVYGTVRLLSFLTGQVYIDNALIDEITAGEAKEYDLVTGSHQIEVRSVSETQKSGFTITQGRTTSVTLRASARPATMPPVSAETATKVAPEGMVLIPAGSFMMGSDDGDDDEKPVHEVYVDAFYLDQHEVTVAKFREFVNVNSYKTDAEKEGFSYIWNGTEWEKKEGINWRHNAEGKISADNYPVIYISWNDATAYGKWAQKRLPSEAEWEYAARSGGKGYKYAWGNDNPTGRNGGNVADESAKRSFGWWWTWEGYDDGFVYTAPVGSFAPNEFKLYDMTGNVWEWCSSLYKPYPYKPGDGREDLSASGPRVVRGGSWYLDPRNVCCAARHGGYPTFRIGGFGFRCAQDTR